LEIGTRNYPCWAPPRHRLDSGGYTLIELIAVLVITAVLAGTAVPVLKNLAGTRSSAAARALLHDLAYARQRSIATGTVCWVVIAPGTSGGWSLLAEDPDDPGRSGAVPIIELAAGSVMAVQLDVDPYINVTIDAANLGGGSEIGFDWLGRPFIDDDSELSVVGEIVFSGNARITVQPITGHAALVP
jgi:prepilin-type N-terminal cleavage/methylation domain-containing protein